ncbi:MAG: IclR family transcriptional regulator, partial [Actinobacteria bacterium]|nr:IclR family transcriptional regulator [Actinomycetota bacterium]
ESAPGQVGSVARALELVELIVTGPSEGLTLSEIVKTAGGSKSAVLATLRTLVHFGYLRTVEVGPRYLPGMMLIRLGDLAVAHDPLIAVARPILSRLSEKSGLTIRVARNDAGFPIFLDRVDGAGFVRFHTPLGVRELPHVSSAGKAILAHLGDDQIKAVAKECGLVARTKNSITTLPALKKEMEKIRLDGFATDNEEDAQGIFCVGAPFFDHFGKCLGAISATGVKTDLSDEQIEKLGKLVIKHADQLTKELHGRKIVRRAK